MRARLSSRRFVGREGELAELQLAVREAAAGHPSLVLLGGDSGVGKTRLVAELTARLGEDDEPALVLRGEAVQPTDGELPYAPVLGALRPLVRDADPILTELHPAARAQLASILPGLETSFGSERRHEDQLQLFEALLALVHDLSERQPLVLVLEDMHWADRSSRAWLAFLARSLDSERVAIIVSFRSDELHRRHPLRPLLSELERIDGARRVDLRPFDHDELSAALQDILGSAPDPALVQRLLERAEGNPLYTEELLAAGLDGRAAPPRSLNDAFLGRIERLSAEAQRVARAVAVGGRVDQPAIAAVTELPDAALLGALREAVAEQVLVADGDDFAFRHALLREALADDLLPGERGQLHLALASHLELEQAGDLQRAARIAGHYAAAGDQRAALRTTVVAADVAFAAQAFGDAADLYARALELWPRVDGAAGLTGTDRVALVFRCAEAHSIVGERARTEALVREALAVIDPERDPLRYAHALAERARAMWALNQGPAAVATGEQALEACPPGPGGDAEALAIRAWLARLQVLRGRYRDACEAAEPALVVAIAAGDQGIEAELRDTLGQALIGLGDVDAGLASLRHSLAIARDAGDIRLQSTIIHNLADDLVHLGRAAEALQIAQDGLDALPLAQVRQRDWLDLTVSRCAFETGDWARSAEHLPPVDRMVGIESIFRHTREAELAAGIGDDDRAQRCLDSIAGLVCDSMEPQWIGPYGGLNAELALRRGDLEGARQAVEDAIGRMEICTDDVFRIVGLSVIGLRIEADRAQRARDLGDAALKRDALARVRVHLARLQGAEQDERAVVRAAVLQARAEAGRARGRSSAGQWARSAGAWEDLGLPYRTAIARWRVAEAALGDGDRDRACEAARAAVGAAHELGARWLEGEARGLAERARLSLDAPAVSDAGPSAPVAADPFGLTERERQVLALVSQGATNRQIGAALYMAEKTASVHVSRILAKLDVHSRTEAAAVAHRQHLV